MGHLRYVEKICLFYQNSNEKSLRIVYFFLFFLHNVCYKLFSDQSDNEGDNGGDNDNANVSQSDNQDAATSSPDRNKAGG